MGWLSEVWREWQLIFSRQKFDKRIARWEKHIEVFSYIAATETPPLSKAEGLKFAFTHLNTLDSKFGFLLPGQVLIAAAVGFAVNTFPWDKVSREPCWFALSPRATWLGIILLLALLWTANILLTLYGMRSVVWGGMRTEEDLQKARQEGRGPEILIPRAQEYVTELVSRVAKRTAIFRIAILSTFIGAALAAPFMFTIIYLKSLPSEQQLPKGKQERQEQAQQRRQGQQESEIDEHGRSSSAAESTTGYEIVTSKEYVHGRLSHSHTFLLNKANGEVRQLICRTGTKLLRFEVIVPAQ